MEQRQSMSAAEELVAAFSAVDLKNLTYRQFAAVVQLVQKHKCTLQTVLPLGHHHGSNYSIAIEAPCCGSFNDPLNENETLPELLRKVLLRTPDGNEGSTDITVFALGRLVSPGTLHPSPFKSHWLIALTADKVIVALYADQIIYDHNTGIYNAFLDKAFGVEANTSEKFVVVCPLSDLLAQGNVYLGVQPYAARWQSFRILADLPTKPVKLPGIISHYLVINTTHIRKPTYEGVAKDGRRKDIHWLLDRIGYLQLRNTVQELNSREKPDYKQFVVGRSLMDAIWIQITFKALIQTCIFDEVRNELSQFRVNTHVEAFSRAVLQRESDESEGYWRKLGVDYPHLKTRRGLINSVDIKNLKALREMVLNEGGDISPCVQRLEPV